MAEYYSGYDSRRSSRKPRRGVFMLLVDAAMTLLTAVVAATTVIVWLLPYVNPAKMWVFPVLSPAAPVIYLATMVAALYWIVRWRWVRAGIMLSLVVIGLFRVPLFYKPELMRDYDVEINTRNTILVMTYNLRNFYGEDGKSSADGVAQMIGERDPDIICAQEFNSRLADKSRRMKALLDKYERATFGRQEVRDSLSTSQLAIFSKYRILRSGRILAPNVAVWADLLIGDDTVRVFNNHLRTTAIKASEGDYITNRDFLADSARETKLRSMVGRMSGNSALRAEQADSISKVVDATATRLLVCGDFNETPVSYVYRTMSRGLNDAFSEAGKGYSHTFHGFANALRIDYVLSSEGFETLSYEVLPAKFSDHLPVFVRLKKTNN